MTRDPHAVADREALLSVHTTLEAVVAALNSARGRLWERYEVSRPLTDTTDRLMSGWLVQMQEAQSNTALTIAAIDDELRRMTTLNDAGRSWRPGDPVYADDAPGGRCSNPDCGVTWTPAGPESCPRCGAPPAPEQPEESSTRDERDRTADGDHQHLGPAQGGA
jgi:hypothetical protein